MSPATDPDDEPIPLARQVALPVELSLRLPCPDCDELEIVAARLFVRRTRDSDGTTSLTVRTRAPKIAHSCGQTSLGLTSGPLTR